MAADPVSSQAVSPEAARLIILEDLTKHVALMVDLAAIQLDPIRYLRPLGDRADAMARARRRVDGLPSRAKLDDWYRTLKQALDGRADRASSRRLVAIMMDAMRGRPEGAMAIETFVIALEDARMSPDLVAGAIKRAWLEFKTKPSLQAFLRLCARHRADTQQALDDVVNTMGLRKDAERVLASGPGDLVVARVRAR